MTAASLDRHVDRRDGGAPRQRYRPRPAHGSKVAAPLEEVTLHRVGSPGHWHLVTRGLTELEAKESPDPARSGWGFELTLRLAGGEDDEPEWAVDLLTNLAAYVWTSGNVFAPGHHLDLSGPMQLDTTSSITAAAMVQDPGLGAIKTSFGRVEFLQVVGLTVDELELCRAWNTEGVLEFLAGEDPLLVTRLDRASLLADPDRAAEMARRAALDGSSLTELRVASLRWTPHRVGASVLTLGAGASAALGPALRRELIGPGATFAVISDPVVARFEVAETAGWQVEGDTVQIDVPLAEVEGLAALFDGRRGQGRRPAWPGLRFRVVA